MKIFYVKSIFVLVTNEMKVDPVMDGTNLEDEKCEVRNLSCVAFPTKMQCQGIAMGGCVGKFFFREIKGKKNLRFHEFFFQVTLN